MSDIDEMFPDRDCDAAKVERETTKSDPMISDSAREGVRAMGRQAKGKASQAARVADEQAKLFAAAALKSSGSLKRHLANGVVNPRRWLPYLKLPAIALCVLLGLVAVWAIFQRQIFDHPGSEPIPSERQTETTSYEAQVSASQKAMASAMAKVDVPASSATNEQLPSQVFVLPPVPDSVTGPLCDLGLPTINEAFATTRARTAEEGAWIKFGYACVEKGFLTTRGSAFVLSPPAPSTKSTARNDKAPAVQPAAAPKPKAKQAKANPPKPSTAAMAPMPLVSTLAVAQPKTCALLGVIQSQDGSPIAGATLSIKGQGNDVAASATSGTDGAFHFDDLPDGKVGALVSAKKHLDYRADLTTCGRPIAIRMESCFGPVCALRNGARKLDQKINMKKRH